MKRNNARFVILPGLWVVLLFAIPLHVTGQTLPSKTQTDKIKLKIEKIGIRQDLTVKLNDGKTYHGFINRIDDESFEVTEVDLKSNLSIRYDEVKSIESGYGEKGPLGNRVGKKGRRLGMIIALTATVVIPVLLVLAVKGN